MIEFSLVMGHLVGDLLLQNDRQAKSKNSEIIPPETDWPIGAVFRAMPDGGKKWSDFVCFIHVCMYMLGLTLCCFWFMPVWGYVLIASTHYFIDRYKLARKLMHLSGQDEFASGPLSPWSIVVVDQVLHLLVLWIVGIGIHFQWWS